MSECHCIVYHSQDPDDRERAMDMARSGDPSIAVVGLAMLAPCPSRVDTNN